MLIPPIADPRDLIRDMPKGTEFDGERAVTCLCGKSVAVGGVKLVWLNFSDGWGYRAVCGQSCYVAHLQGGAA